MNFAEKEIFRRLLVIFVDQKQEAQKIRLPIILWGSVNPYPGPILMLIIKKLYLCLEPDKVVKIIPKEFKLKAIKLKIIK